MPRFDFDALRSDKEQFDVTIDGRTIIFPKEVPADRVLDLRKQALEIDDKDEAGQTEFFLHMGREIMSEESFDFLRSRLGVTELFNVIDELCIYYGIQERAEDESEAEGKPQTPEETPEAPDPADPSESSISSSTTDLSSRTSNVYGLVPTPSSEPADSPGDVSSVG